MRRVLTHAVAAIVAWGIVINGQESARFTAASVKRNNSGDFGMTIPAPMLGRFRATNVSVRQILSRVYSTATEIVAAPSWIDAARFDIVATMEGNPDGRTRTEMLRNLLADRFQLRVHIESRPGRVYALTPLASGKPASRLHASTAECRARIALGPASSAPNSPSSPCGMSARPGRVTGVGVTMSQLVTLLSQYAGRRVMDQTGWPGEFDFELIWTPDLVPSGAPPAGAPVDDAVGGSLFTAVREQLGLSLVDRRMPVDVLVIDRILLPSDN
jgi:uncharacterized protein (TIGR03435 family)